MRNVYKILSPLGFLLMVESIFCQNINCCQQDLQYYYHQLLSIHPIFNDTKNHVRYEVDSLYKIEQRKLSYAPNQDKLLLSVLHLTYPLQDEHSTLHGSSLHVACTFPFRYAYIDGDGFYITKISKQYRDVTGKVIKSINGIPIEQLMDDMDDYSYGNETCKYIRMFTLQLFCQYEYLKQEKLLNNNQLHLQFTDGDTIVLNKETAADEYQDKWYTFIVKPHPITRLKEDKFSYTIDDKNSICYLQFNSFYDRRMHDIDNIKKHLDDDSYIFVSDTLIPSLSECLSQMLYAMQKHGTQTLVIDLRNNTGGYLSLIDEMLCALYMNTYTNTSALIGYERTNNSYFDSTKVSDATTKQPKSYRQFCENMQEYLFLSAYHTIRKAPRFKGRVIFLQGSYTASTAVVLLSMCRDLKTRDVLLVGTNTMGSPNNYGDAVSIELPNTQLNFDIPQAKISRLDRSINENTIYPDVYITCMVNDLSKGIDPYWDWVVVNHKTYPKKAPSSFQKPMSRFKNWIVDILYYLHKFIVFLEEL